MAIDNFCEGKSMVTTDYEILKKAAAELNEIMHAAHINASDRAIYVSGMLLSMYDEYLSPDSFPEYNLESRDSRFIYNHLLTFLGTVLSGEKYEMVSREFEVLVSDPERDRYIESISGSYTRYIFTYIYNNIFLLSDGVDSIGELFGEFLKYTVQMATENGKVLTPSYISHLMAKLIHIKDSDSVLDVCAGSGGMLVAAMDEMNVDSKKLGKNQFRGIEINPRMATLAISNMILRGITADSIVKANTFYHTEEKKYDKLLINPDFTCEENGLPFLSYGLNMLREGGEGAVIIQDSAGGGIACDSARLILSQHTLLGSIKMPLDLFSPNAKVQTSIYIFKAHVPHDYHKEVLFIDFRNDGCKRTKRGMKHGEDVWRLYSDLVKAYNERKEYPGIPVILDRISDSGCDWNYENHIKNIDKITEKDISAEVINSLMNKIKEQLSKNTVSKSDEFYDMKPFSLEDLFEVKNCIYYRGVSETDLYAENGTVPVITNTALNNGIKGYSNMEACNKGNVITISDTIGDSSVFYQEKDFIGFPHLKKLIPKKNKLPCFDELIGRYIAAAIRKSISGKYNYTTKLNKDKILKTKIYLPYAGDLVDIGKIRKIMLEEQSKNAKLILNYINRIQKVAVTSGNV